jgi:hypothetical protein
MPLEINLNEGREFYSYPSIEQFRNVIHNVNHKAHYVGKEEDGSPQYDYSLSKPILKFIGTTKLHGTNAAMVIDLENKSIYFQSRERIITPQKDNAGFATYMSSIQDKILEKGIVFESPNRDLLIKTIIIYGEWCGGNIQKGVAINGLDKMFVIFDIRLIDKENNKYWLPPNQVKLIKFPELKIYNIYDFQTWEIDIDFNNPQLSQNKLVEITTEVEQQCPVGKHFGNEGIGEGVVWKCITPNYNDSGFWMKVKGEKHSNSKVKTVKEIAEVDIRKIENIKVFVDTYVSENRCKQSIDKLKEAGKPTDRTSLGDYLKWIISDIYKEEIDTITQNGFEMKDLNPSISNKAREWFFKNEIYF